MCLSELVAKWSTRRDEYRRLSVMVDGARLCEEVLGDLRLLIETQGETVLSISDAAAISGYSREHLGRLVKEGKLENVGRPHAPRVRRGDLPMKPSSLPSKGSTKHIVCASRRQTVRSVVDSGRGTR
jgi:hypothetical protein